jgi:hypothetical protein
VRLLLFKVSRFCPERYSLALDILAFLIKAVGSE